MYILKTEINPYLNLPKKLTIENRFSEILLILEMKQNTENTEDYFPKQNGIIKFSILLRSVPALFSKI